jgi:hypothetical protein
MFEYLTIKEKITPTSLEALGGEDCFLSFSEKEAQQLLGFSRQDLPQECNMKEFELFLIQLSQASNLVKFSYSSIHDSSDISKASLLGKSKVIETYLNANEPEWQNKMKIYFSSNVLRIVKMILVCEHLDCSVLYLIDRVIDKDNSNAYHSYVFSLLYIAADENQRFYNFFYDIKTHKTDSKYRNALTAFRSYSNFKRANKLIRIVGWSESFRDIFYLHRISKVCIQAPPLNAIYRLSSLISCDYRLQNFY